MLILSIDSTSFLPRVALTKNEHVIQEVNETRKPIDWEFFNESDGSYLHHEFSFQIKKLFQSVDYTIEDVDCICYSGVSGFKKSMFIGKVYAEILGNQHDIPVVPVDHITSHYFSSLIGRKAEDIVGPILFFSASGSHNSFAVLQDIQHLDILSDETEFQQSTQKYIGLGSIFFRLMKQLDFFNEGKTPNDITEITSELQYEVSQDMIDFVRSHYRETSVFDTSFLEVFTLFDKAYIQDDQYKRNTLFFSFEEAMIQIMLDKLQRISHFGGFKEIHVVGGISNNDRMFERIHEHFQQYDIQTQRPNSSYRFDNASMLGVLGYYYQQPDTHYMFSKIVTS